MITVYTRSVPGCAMCVAAKARLRALGVAFEDIDLSLAENEHYRFLLLGRGHTTVPQIYYRDRLLVPGGNAELQKLDRSDLERAIERIDAELVT